MKDSIKPKSIRHKGSNMSTTIQTTLKLAAIVAFAGTASATEIAGGPYCQWEDNDLKQVFLVALNGSNGTLADSCQPPSSVPPGELFAQARWRVKPFNETTRFGMPVPLRFRMLIGPLPAGAFAVPLAAITSAVPNPAQTAPCPHIDCSKESDYGAMRQSISLKYWPESHRFGLSESLQYAQTVQTEIGSMGLDLPVESLKTVTSGTYTQIDVEYIYEFSRLTMKACSVANSAVGAVCSEIYQSNNQYYGFGNHTPDLLLGTDLYPHPLVPRVRYCRIKDGSVHPACNIPQ
jgi:hypothetical protein